ncbi:hypothetical protein H072_7596 [Dactylellina haptotyla CBS 200.50]|uniref:Fucose-specific lectin n=1 Tax=Dactylellina haptotyla (strain CBS 200.50) TaxID=1284197 RepID=S8A705_DACHA|nr:hypothetical protein H072_7596 [Dactylellina haptotyla CBS 200.50]
MANRLSVRYEPVHTTEQEGLEVVSVPPPPVLDKPFQVLPNTPAYSQPIPVHTQQYSYNGPPPPIDYRFSQFGQQGYPGGGDNGGYAGGHPQFNGGAVPPAKPERKIWGLKRWVFIAIVIAVIVIIAAAVGGGVGGSLASKSNKSSTSPDSSQTTSAPPTSTTNEVPTSTTSSPPLLATPGTFASVKSSTSGQDDYNSITYFFQDTNTPDIYMWTIIRGQDWVQIGKLDGLNPPPRPNSTFAAVQAPDDDTISLFYVADNGTLFDVTGTGTDTDWRMGFLAPRTNYGVLVAEDSGIAAIWWGIKDMNGPGYSIRIYYVDSAASRVRELAFDANKSPQWFVTDQPLETCLPTAKIAIAHLPPNETSTLMETAHLFYQDRNGNLRHYAGYDGSWSLDNAETISQSTLPSGAYLASTIYVNAASNYTLHVWFLDVTSRLSVLTGLGKSIRLDPNFQNVGTFEARELVSSVTSEYISNGEVPGGSLGAVGWVEGGEQVRIYYQANSVRNDNKNGAVEIAGTLGWASKILEVEML